VVPGLLFLVSHVEEPLGVHALQQITHCLPEGGRRL
jgi:hypothetical protein